MDISEKWLKEKREAMVYSLKPHKVKELYTLLEKGQSQF